jgi:hypothetical protein
MQCHKCPASVHSTNATWQTSFGLTQRHCFIFSAVSDSPQREALFSGRFANGQCAALSVFRVGKISSRSLGTKPFFTFATKMRWSGRCPSIRSRQTLLRRPPCKRGAVTNDGGRFSGTNPSDHRSIVWKGRLIALAGVEEWPGFFHSASNAAYAEMIFMKVDPQTIHEVPAIKTPPDKGRICHVEQSRRFPGHPIIMWIIHDRDFLTGEIADCVKIRPARRVCPYQGR